MVVREGARKMLRDMLEAEVDDFLGRRRYQRTGEYRGYRNDFEPVFRALVDETAAVSPSSILKLKADWQQEYETWKKRPLRGRYVYLYADGVYLKAGTERDTTAVLVVLGVDEHGHKELLAMDEGYRESTASWSE